MPQLQLEVEAALGQWEHMRDAIDLFLKEHYIDEKSCFTIMLCCEEWFINIVNHGYSKADNQSLRQSTVSLVMEYKELSAHMVILFIDSGVPFNPLQYSKPLLDQSVEERTIGGLGIYFIRTKMDQCQYEYRDEKNYFKMIKKL